MRRWRIQASKGRRLAYMSVEAGLKTAQATQNSSAGEWR